jgi:hypothetical protein
VSYYAQRSARDPEWHAQQLREAGEREQRRRDADPEAFRRARRDVDRRYRERVAQHGLTFAELHRRIGGSRATLLTVLNSERRRGTLDYHSTLRRWSLNGGMAEDVRDALLRIGLLDERCSRDPTKTPTYWLLRDTGLPKDAAMPSIPAGAAPGGGLPLRSAPRSSGASSPS